MLRFLLLTIIGYVLYRLLKGIFGTSKGLHRGPEGGVVDEMVQDPNCKTYIPLRESVKRTVGGQAYFFCSRACADEFESEKK